MPLLRVGFLSLNWSCKLTWTTYCHGLVKFVEHAKYSPIKQHRTNFYVEVVGRLMAVFENSAQW